VSNVVLLSGKQGSGKTTFAEALSKVLLPSTQLKFAQHLYTMHDTILPYIKALGLRPDDMEKDGELLQVLGTEYGRKCLGSDCWVNATKYVAEGIVNKFSQMYAQDLWVIIDDARFENEFDAFPEALRVHLSAPESMRRERAHSWREKTDHPSETGLDNYQEQGKFDLYLHTFEDDTVEKNVQLFLERFDIVPDTIRDLRNNIPRQSMTSMGEFLHD